MHKKSTAFEASILEANSLLKENRQQEAYNIISSLLASSSLSFTYKKNTVSAMEMKILKNLDHLLSEEADDANQSIFSKGTSYSDWKDKMTNTHLKHR